VKTRDGGGSGSVDLRPKEPRRLRASFDGRRFLGEDVVPQTSPSYMDLFEEERKTVHSEKLPLTGSVQC
jgi:hypothetical protein